MGTALFRARPSDEFVLRHALMTAASILLGVALPVGPTLAQDATQIVGRVVDARTGDPLVEATVLVEQGDVHLRAYTDDEGNFAVEVAPGLWVVRAFADAFREARHRPVRVRVGQQASVTLRLRGADEDDLVFEVVEQADTRGQAALDGRRMGASTSQDTIGATAMAATGSSTAARAASRVVGASLESGTLIVRGLGDRYTNVLMNGVVLPGSDPDRNGVQLDVIPAAVIANISVIKTFQPEIPANWAGGLMVIESQAMPDRFEVRLAGQLGYNSTATFRNTLTSPGTPADLLGLGLHARRLPSAVPADLAVVPGGLRPDGSQLLPADTAAIGRAFPRHWDYSRALQGPNGTLQFSIGNRHALRHDRTFGYLAGLSYQRSSQVRIGTANQIFSVDNANRVTFQNQYASEATVEDVLLTGFGTAALRYSPTGSVRLLAMYSQQATDETRVQSGTEREVPVVERWQLQYVQRSVLFTQLVGEHGGIRWWTDEPARLRYSVYVAQSRRDEPSTRQVRFSRLSDDPADPIVLDVAPNSSDVLSLGLKQTDAGGYLHLNARTWSRGTAEVGVDTRFSQRQSTFRQFHFFARGAAPDPADLLTLDPNTIFAPENIQGPGPIGLRETTAAQNNYVGSSRWFAGYLTTETHLSDAVRIVGGVRVESMHREITIDSPVQGVIALGAGTPSHVARDAVDILPAISVVLSPRERMNIRLSYGRTVVHPQFREFSPSIYYDFARRRNVSGNPELTRTHVDNADIRWEWQHGASGLFALSAFYKHFDQPIERVNVSGGNTLDLRFANAAGGYNVGMELEARFNLGQWDARANWLDWFTFNANVALVYSRVKLTEQQAMDQASSSRAMFFQSPYVANLSLGVDEPVSGVSLTAAYNVVGPRIVEVGVKQDTAFTPNTIERPFHQLDMIGGYQMNSHWRLTLTVRNMLRSFRTMRQGVANVERYTPGTDVLLGVAFVN